MAKMGQNKVKWGLLGLGEVAFKMGKNSKSQIEANAGKTALDRRFKRLFEFRGAK